MPDKIKLACLSLPGRKHTDKGQPNEDACVSVFSNGVYVVCLSDGAGGNRYTHAAIGSQSVVGTVSELLTKHFDAFYNDVRENVIRSILVTAIQSELAILTNENHIDGIERLSATMLFCAVKDTRMICGHIGDGIIAKVSSSGIVPMTLPQNGENTGSTYFITFPDAQDYIRVVRTTTDDAHAIVLMTDGLADMVYDSSTYLVRPVVARLAELADLPSEEKLVQLKDTIQNFVINSSNLSDDASIGILYFAGSKIPDISEFVSEKPLPDADYKDVMRSVQLELLPRVKLARSIVNKDPETADTEGKTVDGSDLQIRDTALPSSDEAKVFRSESHRKRSTGRVVLWSMIGVVIIAAIIILIIVLNG